MFTSEMSEEVLEDEDGQNERPFINQALDFYKRNTNNPQRLSSVGVGETVQDDTREFIILSLFK